jgi:hypothetical protein
VADADTWLGWHAHAHAYARVQGCTGRSRTCSTATLSRSTSFGRSSSTTMTPSTAWASVQSKRFPFLIPAAMPPASRLPPRLLRRNLYHGQCTAFGRLEIYPVIVLVRQLVMYADVTGKPRLDMREVHEYREKVNMMAGRKQKDEDLIVFAPMQLAQIRKVPSRSRPYLSALALGSPPFPPPLVLSPLASPLL